MDNTSSRVVVVTGANSGIGRATAIGLAGHGYTVVGTVRGLAKATKLQSMAEAAGVTVHLVEADVADDDSVRDAFGRITDEFGPVDHLVNNAGVGGNAVTEDCSIAFYHEVMNVNFYGALRCIHAVLPAMRERRAGTIVNVSSVVGKVAAIAQQPYVSSKWALEGMSEGLAQEMAPFGVRVAIVEPGITRSAIFAKNVDVPPGSSPDYAAHYRRLFQFYAAGLSEATDPAEVAEVVRHAIETDQPRLRYSVSWGGPELINGRAAMSDEDWVAMGASFDDADYYGAFQHHFGVSIAP